MPSGRPRTRGALWALALLAVATARGQTPDPSVGPKPCAARGRPAIGLVLSGGGARGGAHIGVLKALRELRVPIDCIAGTSVGAVVGGFYVAGLTVEDLENVVQSLEWETAFLNVTPRKLKSFRRKRDDDLFLVSQKPGLNHGEIELPAGLVQGQIIDMILSRETLRASLVSDFDDLKLPFRAVAGDIATGEAVVLGQGSLARALRASMSIPAALAPIDIDGRLLVDGGIAMNLPVEVARSMGAEVVIAVDVSSPLRPRRELNSLLDVTTQLTNLLTRAGTEEQRKKLTPRDVLVVPEFGEDVSSVSFERMAETEQAGYDAVMKHRAELAKYALDEPGYRAYVDGLKDPRMRELPPVDFVHLENHSPIADSVVQTRLRDIKIGQPLDVDAVEKAIDKVYGLEYYQNVRYGLVDDNGATGLDVELDPRSWGPNYLQLGVEYSSAGDEDVLFGLAASYLRTEINRLGGEFRTTFVIGDEPAFLNDLYLPFGSKGLYFFAPSFDFQSKLFNVFQDGQRVTEAQVRDATVELAVGRELPSWGEYRFGTRIAYGDSRLRVGDPALLPEDTFHRGEFFAKFSVDTMDSVSFPRAGVLATAEWRGSRQGPLHADTTFDQMLLSAAAAKTWGRHTVLGTLRYDATISGTAPFNRMFRMGGFFDLSGLNRNQLAGQEAVRIGASYYRRIGDLALFPAFAGVSVELGNVWQSRSDVSLKSSLLGGSLWAGVSTPVGPVYVAYGRVGGGGSAFYVYLGRIF
jgi:NTE family protein